MIQIIGAGAFGTALAVALSKHGPLRLVARRSNIAKAMEQSRQSTYLPGIKLPDGIEVSDQFQPSEDPVLLALPMQNLRGFLKRHPELASAALVACCKGIELQTGLRPTSVIKDVLPSSKTAILTGPSFAADIAKGMPTALTIASDDAVLAGDLQTQLSTHSLRLYRSSDVIGAELGGALKNVIAIACGAVMGAGLGESARAALMTRGFSEMCRLADALGANPKTLAGLSGFGDLALTCASDGSRNFRYGISLGREDGFDPTITVEGAPTARAILSHANEAKLDMPITQAVVALMDQKLRINEAMDMLLSRPLKEEEC